MFNENGRGFKLPKVLSREDAAKLINATNTNTFCGLRDKVAMLLMYRAALRVSEVCSLTVDDVDLDNGLIFVQLGKGNKDRVVPMDHELLLWCKKWVSVRPESEYFVCTKKGTPVLDRHFRKVITNYAKKVGVYIRDGKKKKTPHPHTLRHCCLTELVEDGFTVQEVQAIAGHRSIVTTAKYLWVRPEQLAKKIRERRGMEA